MDKTCFCGISEHCGYQIETDMEQHDKVIYEQGYNQAITEFAERLKDSLINNFRHFLTIDSDGFDWLTTDAVFTHIDEIAEQMKGVQ